MTIPLHVSSIEDSESDTELVLHHLEKASYSVTSQRAEEELQRWAQIFQYTEWGVAVSSADGKVVELCNPAFAKMHGYSVEQIVGNGIADLFAAECRDDISGNIQLAHQTGHQIWESQHVHKDGYAFPVLIDITAVKNEEGQVNYCVINAQDITERKRVEQSLRLSEEKFFTAFRVSPDSININRLKDGLYIEINEGFKALTGYTAEEVIGKTSLEINIWDNLQDRSRLVQGLRENGEVVNLEAPFRIKNGTVKICLMSARIIEINGELCILSITRDITDRKLKEREYSTFIQTSFDGFWCVDISGHFLDVNDAFCQMLGYTREELCTMCIPDIEVNENPEEVAARIQRIIQAGSDRFQTRHRRKDGKVIDVEISAQYVALGKRCYVFIHDITERKQVEDKIKDQLEELRRWHAVTLGREERIHELKKEVNHLLIEAGKPLRYASAQETA